MKVSYKGVTGELIKLEAVKEWPPMLSYDKGGNLGFDTLYSLEIWDNEKKCKVSFAGVSLKDVKFLGGEVTYG